MSTSQKPHSPCTQFFSSKITDSPENNCSLFIGHEDGAVSLISCQNMEGSLANLNYSLYIEQIHSEAVVGFLEFSNEFTICWSRRELKIIDKNLKIVADLTSHLNKNCGNIRGVLQNDYNITLLVFMESGTVIQLKLGCQFVISSRSEISLIELLPKNDRQNVGQVKLVGHSRFCNEFIVTWTESYFSIFSNVPEIKFVKWWPLEVKMNVISPDGSLAMSIIGNQIEGELKPAITFLDLSADEMKILREYERPTEDVLSIGFSEMRYQALFLTEIELSVYNLVSSSVEGIITPHDLEKKFNFNLTNVKFKFLLCTEHIHFVLLEELGMVIGFNTARENLEEVISVDKAFILPLPVHKKKRNQQAKLLHMATEQKLTNIEFCF